MGFNDMKNEEIIGALAPVLDAIVAIDNRGHVNDVDINLSRKDGAYVIKISAWAKSCRITAPNLDSLVQAVKDFDSARETKRTRLIEIKNLKNKVLELEKLI